MTLQFNLTAPHFSLSSTHAQARNATVNCLPKRSRTNKTELRSLECFRRRRVIKTFLFSALLEIDLPAENFLYETPINMQILLIVHSVAMGRFVN